MSVAQGKRREHAHVSYVMERWLVVRWQGLCEDGWTRERENGRAREESVSGEFVVRRSGWDSTISGVRDSDLGHLRAPLRFSLATPWTY